MYARATFCIKKVRTEQWEKVRRNQDEWETQKKEKVRRQPKRKGDNSKHYKEEPPRRSPDIYFFRDFNI